MAIRNVPTGRTGLYQDVPSTPVIIESVVLLEDKSTEKAAKPADKK